jgi:hypothetical protein
LVNLVLDGTGCVLDAARRVNKLDAGPAARAEDSGLHDHLGPRNPDWVLANGAAQLKITVEKLGRKRFGHQSIMPLVRGWLVVTTPGS